MNKIKDIITKNFDSRLDATVLAYIVDKGWDFVSHITEEEISELEGNPMMTKNFVQSLVRTAVIITKETSMMDDFFPYIAERFRKDDDDEWNEDDEE